MRQKQNMIINEQINICFLKGFHIPGSHLDHVFMCSLYLAAGWEAVRGRREREMLWSRIRSKLIIKQCGFWKFAFPFLCGLEKHWRNHRREGKRMPQAPDALPSFSCFTLTAALRGGHDYLHFSAIETVQRDEVTCCRQGCELASDSRS